MAHHPGVVPALVVFATLLGFTSDRAIAASPPSASSWAKFVSPLVGLPCASVDGGRDGDGDGLADACEDELADRFAPIVYHSSAEPNYPTNVDAFLEHTELFAHDDECFPDLTRSERASPTQRDLLGGVLEATCGNGGIVRSDGTRSANKQRTFFLSDLALPLRVGSTNADAWKTYVHAYPNDVGGVTLQYWRFYAFNEAALSHGGDWEGLHVVLDRSLEPAGVRLLGHRSIEMLDPASLGWEASHVRVFSEVGGHATRLSGESIEANGCDDRPCRVDPSDARTFTRQETWRGGAVSFFDGRREQTGALVNMGAKRKPLNGQAFVAYSGLWGSPGYLYSTSGYWGPAYNETAMARDGFVTAWCAGMVGSNLFEECNAAAASR